MKLWVRSLSGIGLVVLLGVLGLLSRVEMLVLLGAFFLSNVVVLYHQSAHWRRACIWWQDYQGLRKRRRQAQKKAEHHAMVLDHLRSLAQRSGLPWIVEFFCAGDEVAPPRWLLHSRFIPADWLEITQPIPFPEALDLARRCKAAPTDLPVVPWRVRNLLTGQEVLC